MVQDNIEESVGRFILRVVLRDLERFPQATSCLCGSLYEMVQTLGKMPRDKMILVLLALRNLKERKGWEQKRNVMVGERVGATVQGHPVTWTQSC